ncbi:ABC transporter permease subunit [Proteinivorax hydrogeniformans]|uniref:ABC transporter permease subunit n=1 Tax=Proteinivorax hydrogeniformans TaxID=1826727 RepID=A0AAU8HVP4_9FIRM
MRKSKELSNDNRGGKTMWGLLKFEAKKLIKSKKIGWLLIVVTVITAGIYYQNVSQYSNARLEARSKIGLYARSIGIQQEGFIQTRENRDLNEKEAELYLQTQDMLRSLFYWRAAQQEESLILEAEFYHDVVTYEKMGGEPLLHLQGLDKEIAIGKNAWLLEHNMFYEDEKYPESPHLNLIQSSSFLFKIVGILTLVFFFGTGLSDEKDEGTWATLKTQPIPTWKLIISKYASLAVVIAIFLIMVTAVGLIIPVIFSDYSIKLNYPQVLKTDDTFVIVTTSLYLARASLLFIFASFFAFSVAMIFNKTCKNSFTTLIFASTVLIVGYFLADWIFPLQNVINPFYHFYYDILSQPPKVSDLMYPLTMLAWSSLCILLAIYIPQKQLSLLYVSNFKRPFNKGKIRNFRFKKWNINIFQWRKIVRKGLLLKTFGLLIILVVFLFSTISQQADEVELTYIGMLENEMDRIQFDSIPEAKENMERSLENAQDEESYYTAKKEWEAGIQYLKTRSEKIKAAVEGYHQGNWEPLYKYQLFDIKSRTGDIETGRAMRLSEQRGTPAQFSTQVGLEETKLLLKSGVTPILLPQNQLTNIFENIPKEHVQFLKKNNIRMVDESGLFILYHYFERYIYFIPLVIFIFILGGGVASERGTFALLKTQPVSDKNLFFGGLINAKTAVVLSCIAFFLIALLVSTVADRFGDWNYPILRYDPESVVCAEDYTGTEVFVSNWNRGFHFVTLGRHLLESLGLFIALALFFTAITNVVALIIRNKVGVMSLTAAIGVGGYQFSQLLKQTAHLSPFTYLNIPKVISGEYATLLDNSKINLANGIMLLLLLAALVIVAGYIILSKPPTTAKRSKTIYKS